MRCSLRTGIGMALAAWVALGLVGGVQAQEVCQPTLAYSICEIRFTLDEAEAKAHPQPYQSVLLRAEVRSPRHKTYLMPAFWDGGRNLTIRVTPTEEGTWAFRLTSNLKRFDGKEGTFEATPSTHPGFVVPATVRHWQYGENRQPHLWYGYSDRDFVSRPAAAFEAELNERLQQRANHVSGLLLPADFPFAKEPDVNWLREAEKRIRLANEKGVTVDLTLFAKGLAVGKLWPNAASRERFLRYLAARFSAFDITWVLSEEAESVPDTKAALREVATVLRNGDPLKHPITTGVALSASIFGGENWLQYGRDHSNDGQLGAIDHQTFAKPMIATVDSVKRLWQATMNGQYPEWKGKGDEQGAKAWFEFFAGTRHWELEPYFDVDGGRCLALEGIEYIVYIEKPSQPVEVLVEKHGYDVYWVNPLTGERQKQKEWKGEKFVAEAPNRNQPWVLHLSRDGKKEGMLKSYKFESRYPVVQEIEGLEKLVPFVMAEPSGDTLRLGQAAKFSVQVKRQTRATRLMQYVWTAEVSTGTQGTRIIGIGSEGTLRLTKELTSSFPAVLSVRVLGMNANGKVYSIDKVFQLTE